MLMDINVPPAGDSPEIQKTKANIAAAQALRSGTTVDKTMNNLFTTMGTDNSGYGKTPSVEELLASIKALTSSTFTGDEDFLTSPLGDEWVKLQNYGTN
jgi:hypothetical protein